MFKLKSSQECSYLFYNYIIIIFRLQVLYIKKKSKFEFSDKKFNPLPHMPILAIQQQIKI